MFGPGSEGVQPSEEEMPELRLFPLTEKVSDVHLSALTKELQELGVKEFPEPDEDVLDLEEPLGDDQLTDFMDRLEAHDLACDIYLPLEFDGTVEVDDQNVGSAYALLDALEELREELSIDDEGADIEEDEIEIEEVILEQLRFTWRSFLRAANTCIERQVPLHVLS
jgi:hypothetical protein